MEDFKITQTSEVVDILRNIEKQLELINTDSKLNLYTIDDIVETTGIGHATVYSFFNNKNKYPTFPGFKAGKKYLVEVKKFNNWISNYYKNEKR